MLIEKLTAAAVVAANAAGALAFLVPAAPPGRPPSQVPARHERAAASAVATMDEPVDASPEHARALHRQAGAEIRAAATELDALLAALSDTRRAA